MKDTNTTASGINRRDILKGAAAAGAIGIVGLPTLSGTVAAGGHVGTTTVVSDTTTTVTRRRAGTGQNEAECVFTDVGVNAVPIWEHPAWADTTDCFDGSGADWIWHSVEAKQVPESDEYYVENNVQGEVVEFEKEFNLAGPPIGGSVTIAVDNGFEAYVNGTLVASRAVNDVDGGQWECSDLKLPYVETDGWKTGGDCANITHTIPAAALQQGTNTLTVLAVNAHNRQDAEVLEDGENPGGLIYELEASYERCEACDAGTELLAKYEWEDGRFVAESSDEHVTLGEVTTDADGEPIEACFSTDYCNVDVVVKAGTAYEISEDVSGDLCVTGIEAENPGGQTVTYAISNVRFFCEAPEDVSVGRRGGNGRGR